MLTFRCDLDQPATPLRHSWSHTVGSGHAPLGLRADWQAQLRRCRDELGLEYVRFHGTLSNLGMFEVHGGEPVDSFFNADQIYDFLLSIGMKPFVELSFMPEFLASGGKTVFNYASNITPPKDLGQWAGLIGRFVQHLVDRYGADEVRTWYFEVWNEPNLKHFWTGTQADYFDLYRATADAIKAVDPEIPVGGPATANNEWVEDFLDFCEANDLPADFVTTHHYPTDAFGDPGDNTEQQLADSHRNVLRERTQDSVRRARGRPVIYTEWNTSSNPFFWRHDTPYAAAFVAKTWLDVANLVEGYAYWTFSDLFEENYFSSVPFHGGFGLLTIHGIAKPTYRALQLLHALGDRQLLVDGLHPTVDCWVVRGDEALTVFLTNHALPEHAIEDAEVEVRLVNVPEVADAVVERIDAEHANPRRVWEELGEPAYLSAEQVELLHSASEVGRAPLRPEREGDDLVLRLGVPAHAVAAVTVRFEA